MSEKWFENCQLKECADLRAQISAIQAENKALREALKPFASADERILDDGDVVLIVPRNALSSARATLHKEKAQ